jgi:hypothetical protein
MAELPRKMMTAMPAVKPTVTAFDMYRMNTPILSSPRITRMEPARKPAVSSRS